MAKQIDEEEPLDPVMERVRVKMVRLLVVSIGVMVIALMSVLFAIVYKINKSSEEAEVEPAETAVPSGAVDNVKLLENISVDLPDGVSVLSSQISGSRLMLELRMNDGLYQFWIIELQSGKVITRVTTK